MKHYILLLLSYCLLSPTVAQAGKKWSADQVKEVIRQVNTYWQANNPAEIDF